VGKYLKELQTYFNDVLKKNANVPRTDKLVIGWRVSVAFRRLVNRGLFVLNFAVYLGKWK